MKIFKVNWTEHHSVHVEAETLEDAVKQAYERQPKESELYRHLEPIEEINGREVIHLRVRV